MSDPDKLILTQALVKTYQENGTETPALRGIDLVISRGVFAALAGPSGSGKTTLLHLLGGLAHPSSGRIWVGESELTSTGTDLVKYRLTQVGFVFQHYNLMPLLNVMENVEYTMVLQGVPMLERKRRALEVLERVGLKGFENRRPAQLSGGQQQRVAVARSVVCHPELILADEPTASLDSKTGQALIDLMRTLNKEQGITFLFATHDEAILAKADFVIRLRDGLIEN